MSASGKPRATRIVKVWEVGESVHYNGRDLGPADERMVSLDRRCLTASSCIIRVLETEVEARAFGLERDLEDARAELAEEREKNARLRARLDSVREALFSIDSTVRREES